MTLLLCVLLDKQIYDILNYRPFFLPPLKMRAMMRPQALCTHRFPEVLEANFLILRDL